jgi:hypothetical protein
MWSTGANYDCHVMLHPYLSEKITVRKDDRFTFFVCDNLLPQVEAQSLLDTFPVEQLESLRAADASHSTISSIRHPELFQQILAESSKWRELCEWFMSNDFVQDFLHEFKDPILRKYPPIIRHILKPWILKESRYYGEVQFSIRHTGSILSPHTDNADKVLALIVYFPEAHESSEHGGTAFYLPKTRISEVRVFRRYMSAGWLVPFGLRRLKSAKLPTVDGFDAIKRVGEHLDFFDGEYEMALDAPFRLGAAGGFIKNQFSWHDLRLHNFPPGQVRRSLLVNVFLRPSKARALMDRVFG